MKPLRRLWSSGGGASALAGAALCLALLAHGITREVPLGSAEGIVTMQENGRPLPGATVIFRPQFEQEGQPKSRVFTVKADGRFTLRNIPAGEYTVEGQARAHSLEETRIVITEGKPTPLQLELEPSSPYLEMSASQHVFTPDEGSSFLISGFVDEDEAMVDVYKATEEQVVKANGIYNTFQPLSRWNEKTDPQTALGKPVRTFTHKVANRDGEGVFSDYIKMDELPNGVYWVQCRVGTLTRSTYLNVTRLSLITKHVGGEVLCFASDIKTGKALEGVSVGYGKEGTLAPKGMTDGKGVVKFSVAPQANSGDVLVVGKKDDSRAFVNFYNSSQRGTNGINIFTYTDRPVYRPGDEVHFKGIIRKLVGDEFVMTAGGHVEVRIVDADDGLLSNQHLSLNEMGSYNGSFRFNREAPPGSYRIISRYAGSEQVHSLEIAAYRKPEFTVKVKANRPYFVRGEQGKATVTCEYYFGGPVVGAKVHATISRSPYWSYGYEGEEQYYTEEGDPGGEYFTDVEAVTDGRGQAVIEFDTMQEGDPKNSANDYLYTITASVEEGDKYFDGSGSVKVTRGEFGVAVDPEKYVLADGEKAEINVFATYHDAKKPASGKQIRVSIGQETWDGNTSTFHSISTQTVTTGTDGKVVVRMDPTKGGSLTVKAVAEDDRGNQIEAQTYVYIDTAAAAESGGPPPQMSVKLDQKQYKVGDRAKVLIQTGKPGGTAILSVEGDRIYASHAVHLDKGSTVIEIPVTEEHTPNAFVSIAYVHDKKYLESTAELTVARGRKELKVSLSTDKPTYKPGETAIYTIKTIDGDGRPVIAEVSLGIVDESIYAIRKDRTDIVEGFYPMRYNSVQTSYSFPELYLDGGDKTPADIQVRSKFLDTAFWQPSVITDEGGEATVQVTLPDNLTSWRATAVAATSDTAVGQATLNVRARKDLMIRLQTPGFMVQGDTQVLTATINNDTGRDVDVNVDLQATGVEVDGDLRDTVSVEAGQPATMEWTVRATRTGSATFTAKAWIKNGDSDGVKHTVEVQPHGRAVVQLGAGEISGRETLKLAVRPGADPNTGRLLITLSPSLVSTLVQSLDGLIDYPYGCVEQTMSRFLPTVLVAQTIKTMGLPPTPRSAEIPQMVREGYQRLKNMRGYKNGWGWWENDEPDPYMTAYVLEGFHRAAQAGYPSDIDLGRTLEWIKTALKGKDAAKWSRANRLYLAYALALHGDKESAQHFLSQENLDQATASELALACLIDQAVGNGLAQRHLDALLSKATIGSATARWNEEWYGYETTARGLAAVLAVNPQHPVVPKLVRHLMRSRQGSMWMSTRDSTVSLIALTEYLKQAEAGVKPTELTVTLNGAVVKRLQFDRASLFNPDLKVEIPISSMKMSADNLVELSSSAGVSFYSMDFRQYVVQPSLGQVVSGRGLTIQRRYYGLSPKKLEDGSMRLLQTGEAIDEIESGQPVRVVLTIRATDQQEYMMIEDPIPSNCRIMERGAATYDDTWDYWYSQSTVYDDKITFFSRFVPVGTHIIEYTMRAESPGVARALPAVMSNMYEPSIRASSSESRLEVIGK